MINKKRVVVITYSILSFLWGIALAGIVVSAFSAVFIYTHHPIVEKQLEVPIGLELKKSFIVSSSTINFTATDKISVNKRLAGSITLNTPTIYQKSLVVLKLLLIFLSIFYCVHLLRRVLKSIYKGGDFEQRNIIDLKRLAYIVLWSPLLISFIDYLLSVSAKDLLRLLSLARNDEWQFIGSVGFEISFMIYIPIAGLIYVFATVLETGFQLKQENDLTV